MLAYADELRKEGIRLENGSMPQLAQEKVDPHEGEFSSP
jgi:hypothetical protein